MENITPKWIPGTIVKITGPLSYVTELQNGTTVRRHVDSIKKRVCSNATQDSEAEMPGSELVRVPVELPMAPDQEPENLPENSPEADPPLRRSTRSQNPQERYGQ